MIGVPSTIDKYELKKRLGYGGLAEVWKAWDTQLHRYVAIKLLHTDIQHDPNFVTRFEREAQFVASLHHRNIIRIYDFRMYPHREIDVQTMDSNEQIAYMVMEYIEGQTLAQYLRKTSHTGDIPSAADLLHIFEPISLAIDYAHEKGMVHRDIKPSNILLDQRGGQGSLIGEPMLSDFGIAKLLNSSTFSNWRMGTPLYISPEQALGYSENEQCDIYALGVILYEACTGKMPFNGDNPMAIAMQHVNASFPLPHVVNPQLPEALSDVIAKGLAKDPAERFTTASAMCIAMAEAFSLPVSKRLKQAVAHDQESREGELPTVVISSSPSDTPPALHEAVMNVSIPSSISQDDVALESATDSMHRPGQTHESSSIYTLTSIRKKRFRNQAIIALVLTLLVLSASLGTFVVFKPRTPAYNTPVIAPSKAIVGHAYFMSSGLLNQNNSHGINDILLLDLQSLPDPRPGKAYYAWLLPDNLLSETGVINLGRLTPRQGHASLLYQDAGHTNLLALESRVLITQEDATIAPISYTPDKSDWRYYAQLSRERRNQNGLSFSMLDHLRHLLSNAPELQDRELYGGLDMWFLRNTQKLQEWGTAARDVWRADPGQIQRQMLRILDYLDGSSYVQKDIPTIKPALIADRLASQVPLLGPAPPNNHYAAGYAYDDEAAPGYIYLISWHMRAAVLSPGATEEQQALASQIQVSLDEVRNDFVQMHQIARQLALMNDQQLSQPAALTLLDQLVTLAQRAYTGHADPLTGQQQGGAIWICNNIQRMAIFDLQPYTAGASPR